MRFDRSPSLAVWSLVGLVALSCGSSSDEHPSGAAGAAGAAGSSSIDDVEPDDGIYTKSAATDGPFQPWTTTPVDYTVSVSTYELPLAATDIANLGAGISDSDLYAWSPDAQDKLTTRGMVGMRAAFGIDRFEEAYELLDQRDMPILVTADSTLHLYHLFFDQLLKNVEVKELIPMMRSLLPAVRLELASMYLVLHGDMKEAARRDLALITAAEALLSPGTVVVYDVVKTEVDAELAAIQVAGELAIDPILNHGCEPDMACGGSSDLSDESYAEGNACYCHDYTQYKPRGHYTQSEDLSQYFRAIMLLGRIGLRIKSPMETRMAGLLTAALNEATVEGGQPAAELWSKAFRITSFFAGSPDDLTFVDYDRVLREVYGDGFALADLGDDTKLELLRQRLREEREPAILSDFVHAWLDETKATMGLRFFGQRFSFDSYVLSQLTFARVGPNPSHPEFTDPFLGNGDCGGGTYSPATVCDDENVPDWAPICCTNPDVCRVLPSGLDVAAALGSHRAEEHLGITVDHCRFKDNLASLRTGVTAQTDADHWKSLHAGWLFTLEPLFGKDYSAFPTWMAGDTYRDKALNSGLASWAQLRHDTILYTKQSYTSGYGGSGGSSPPPPKEDGYYVEPLPELYSRLSDLTQLMQTGLRNMGLLQPDIDATMNQADYMFSTLTDISIDELAGKPLTDAQQTFIDGFGKSLTSIVARLGNIDGDGSGQVEIDGQDALKTSVVADVHSDPNSGRVLEAGSGKIDWVVVVNKLPNGTLMATVGPIMSYYEFAWPMNDRMTDEQWRTQLDSGTPTRPPWLAGMYASP